MIYKKNILLIFFCCSVLFLFGQDKTKKKINIAIAEVSMNETENYIKRVINHMEDTLNVRKDFNYVSRYNNIAELINNKEDRKEKLKLEQATLNQYRSIGADVLIYLYVSPLREIKVAKDTVRVGTLLGKPVYKSTGEKVGYLEGHYIFYLFDVSTGLILGSKKSNINSNRLIRTYKIQNKVIKFLEEQFPPVTILKLAKYKNGKAKRVIIKGDYIPNKYEEYFVYQQYEYELEGKIYIRSKKVGKISLKQNKGNGQFLATVKSGKKEIYDLLEKKETLICKLRDRPGVGERVSRKLGFDDY